MCYNWSVGEALPKFELDDPGDLCQRLFQVAYMMLHNQPAAEDIAQETIARAIEHAPEFRGEGDLFSWAYSIAINLCRRTIQDDRKHAAVADPRLLDRTPALRRGPATSAVMREAYQRAATAVAGLAPGLREVFILHYIEDLPYETVAAICDISAGAARLRAMRARNALQMELHHLLEPEVRLRMGAEPATPSARAL